MSVLDNWKKYYVTFEIGDVRASTNWCTDPGTFQEELATLEDNGAELDYVKVKDDSMGGSAKTFDVDELREPALDI